ncbi:MAG: serine/threonine-protein phosphatase [Actinomycetota bacterium]|nr:MAG: serine/threonine-protein phosphatase [Actinomycetota bacterium]
MTMALRYAARSDVGLVRVGNEDSGYAGPRLLVVADGMGGHAAGELASSTAIATLAELDGAELDGAGLDGEGLAGDDVLTALTDAIDRAHERIGDVIAAEPEYAGMGTTVTALAWQGERMAIVHVGDSRGYLLRDGQLSQITRDHSYVQTLVDAGRITPAEALTHPRRSLLMRALDGVHEVEPDVSMREVRVGDRYLLCSDGLSGVVPDGVIRTALQTGDPTGAVTRLVELALEAGAPDNVTVVVADVVELGEPPEPAGPSGQPAAAGVASGSAPKPVVVGAAGEPGNRARLPDLAFPHDSQPDLRQAAPTTPPIKIHREPVVAAMPGADLQRLSELYAEEKVARARRRRVRWRLVGAIAFVLVVIAGLGAGVGGWLRTQWYVGESGGYVAVYQGIPGSLLGVSLSSVDLTTTTAVASLPAFDQERVHRTIPASGTDDAQRIAAELTGRAAACATAAPPVGCPTASPPGTAPDPAASSSPAALPAGP